MGLPVIVRIWLTSYIEPLSELFLKTHGASRYVSAPLRLSPKDSYKSLVTLHKINLLVPINRDVFHCTVTFKILRVGSHVRFIYKRLKTRRLNKGHMTY